MSHQGHLLTEDVRLPSPDMPGFTEELIRQLTQLIRDQNHQINRLTHGHLEGVLNLDTPPIAVNATEPYQAGDIIRNEDTTVFGTATSTASLVSVPTMVGGWICTTSGAPGKWRPLFFFVGAENP